MSETVTRAAALLDRAAPGWENTINTETLDLHTVDNCVLGQVYGNFFRGYAALAPFDDFESVCLMESVSLGDHDRLCAFLPGLDDVHVQEWLVEIHNRRSANAEYIQTEIELDKEHAK